MEVPRYTLFIQPILRHLAQHDSPVTAADAYEAAARKLGLTDDARVTQVASGVPRYRNRASWGLNWLKRAGLAESPSPGTWQLTPEGRELAMIDAMPLPELLSRFSSKVEKRSGGKTPSMSRPVRAASEAPVPARGNRKAYRLSPRPLVVGGQAEVYEAVRKADSTTLILKRALGGFIPRMRREIEVQNSLQHRHVMPILDWDAVGFSWYVMPKGKRTMSELARPIDTAQLLEILEGVLGALDVSHSFGHPHRDVKPPNVIELEDESGQSRWVLADWGLTRRAPGMTTAKHTKTGEFLGSEGFAPPEAYRDAHNVGIPGDIYAVGQLIAWATGVDPIPNVSPTVAGPWQWIVELTTAQDPSQRLQSIAEVRALISAIQDSATKRP
jgi:hypothetical protein